MILLSETSKSRGLLLAGLSLLTTCLLLAYFWILDSVNVPVAVFYVVFFVASIATSYAVLSSNLRFSQKVALVLFWSLSVRLAAALRVPSGLTDIDPDALYGRQLAVSILTTGGIHSSALTSFAVKYAEFPMIEILLSSLALIPRLDLDMLIKFGAPFLFSFGLLILMLGFRRLCGETWAVMSGLIGSTYVDLTIHTVHPVIGIVYFALGCYGIIRRNRSAAVIALLSFLVLTVSHDLTPIQAVVILLSGGFLYEVVFREQSDFILLKMGVLLAVTYGMWVTYHANYSMASILNDLTTLFGSFEPTVHVVHISYFGHTVSFVGLIGYALVLAVGFLWSVLRKKDERSRFLIALGFGAGGFFVVGAAPYVLSSVIAPTGAFGNVLPRTLEFAYLLGAPLAVTVIEGVRNLNFKRVKISGRTRTLAAVVLLAILLMPTFYFFVDPPYYDYKAPLEMEDVRLPLHPWLAAGEWADVHLDRVAGTDTFALSADRLSFTFIGSYGRVSIVTLTQAEINTRLLSLGGRPYVPELVIINMIDHPSILNETIQGDNLVYSNSQVVFVVIEPIPVTP